MKYVMKINELLTYNEKKLNQIILGKVTGFLFK